MRYRRMRSYRGHRRVPVAKVLLCLLILAAVFCASYYGFTKILNVPIDEPVDKSQVVVDNNSQNNQNQDGGQQGTQSLNQDDNQSNEQGGRLDMRTDKKNVALRVVFERGDDKSKEQQLKELIESLDKTEINTLVFDVDYLQIGKNQTEDFPLKKLVTMASDAGFHTIMRVDALSLPKRSDISRSYAVQTKNAVTWLDKSNNMWLNPYLEGTGSVIEEYCDAAKESGFNMLEFDQLGFFMQGRLDLADLGSGDSTENRTKALVKLIETAKQKLSSSGVKLAVSIDVASVLDATKASVAQNSKSFLKAADVVTLPLEMDTILANKAVMKELSMPDKVDQKEQYAVLLEKIIDKIGAQQSDKQKLFPLVSMNSKNNAITNNALFTSSIICMEKQSCMGIGFVEKSGAYAAKDFTLTDEDADDSAQEQQDNQGKTNTQENQ